MGIKLIFTMVFKKGIIYFTASKNFLFPLVLQQPFKTKAAIKNIINRVTGGNISNEGNGGNIDITTQGIFGLKFRDELTEKSDITASSQLGVSGRVEINNVNIDPGSGLTELPVEVKDSSQKVAQKCSSSSDNSFVITGRGGVPRNPSQYLNSNQTWSDTRDLSGFVTRNNNVVEDTLSLNKPAIIEATGFIRNSKGEIELIAMENKSFISNSKTDCRGYSK